jgi:hypothetical protein
MLIAPLAVGHGLPLAKHQLEQNAGGRVDEEAVLAEFGQFHRGIGNAEGIELTAIAVVAFEAEADMVDRLTAAVDRAVSISPGDTVLILNGARSSASPRPSTSSAALIEPRSTELALGWCDRNPDTRVIEPPCATFAVRAMR